MDSSTSSSAHPAFVEVIKQLTPDEARILHLLADGHHRPVINIHADNKDGTGGVVAARYVTMIDEEASLAHPELTASYFDNLARLGLVELPDAFLSSPGRYDELENHPNVVSLKQRIDATEGRQCRIQRTLISLTSLGQQFIASCVLPREGEAPRAAT